MQACWHFLLFDFNQPLLWSVVSAHENVTSCFWIEVIMNAQKYNKVMNVFLLCWSDFIQERMRGREERGQRGPDVSTYSRGAETWCSSFEACQKLRGMTEETWPDYCAAFSSKPKSHSTSQTASFCFPPSFLSFLTLQRLMHFIFLSNISSFFFDMTSARRLSHESRTTHMCKICRRWSNWLRGKG